MISVGVTALMVAVECLEVGLSTVSKAAMNGGMNRFVFVVYSNGFAAVFLLLPASLFFYWKRSPPPLTSSVICRIFVLGLLSCGVQTCMYTGIGYSSPTLSSAIGDLTPAFTFILAIFSGMEKLNLRVKSSLAKSIGTIVSIAGALTVTFYKGPAILITSSRSTDSHNKLQLLQTNWVIGGLLLTVAYFFLSLSYIFKTWIIKDYPEVLMVTFIHCIFVTIQSAIVALIAERDPIAWKLKPDMELIAIGYSAVFAEAVGKLVHIWACHKKGPVYTCMFKPLGIVIAIVMGITFLRDTLYLGSIVGAAIIAFGFYSLIWGQAQEEKKVDDKVIILKKFPAIMIILFFKHIFATILAALFSLTVVTDPNAWKLRFDIGLVAVLYNTITVSMIQLTLYAWCISRTGPVFVSMFNPLAIVFSVFMGFLFLGETLWLGSLIGVIIIVVGFYSVMWGKMKEEKTFEYAATTTLKSHRSYDENEPLLQ